MLSTYPELGSKNSGDDLLGKSLAKIVTFVKGEDIQIDTVSASDCRPDTIENFDQYSSVLVPALRPTLLGNSISPQNRGVLLEEAFKCNVPVFAIGSGWKAYPGVIEQSQRLKLEPKDLMQLQKLFGCQKNSEASGMIACRDITTENLLINNNVNCYGTIGDCGLYDPYLIESKCIAPKKVQSVAVSMPHNDFHKEMAYKIALELKKELACDVTITFHGYPKSYQEEMSPHWDRKLINFEDLSGGAEKLSFYDNIDIHVGFRLHAHIWFLRTRKPSLLLGEDGRGMGHLYTFSGLGYSAATDLVLKTAALFPKFQRNPLYRFERRKEPLNLAVKMMKEEITNNYPVTRETLRKVDTMWNNRMKPFIQMIP